MYDGGANCDGMMSWQYYSTEPISHWVIKPIDLGFLETHLERAGKIESVEEGPHIQTVFTRWSWTIPQSM